jgi:hypothetical protein
MFSPKKLDLRSVSPLDGPIRGQGSKKSGRALQMQTGSAKAARIHPLSTCPLGSSAFRLLVENRKRLNPPECLPHRKHGPISHWLHCFVDDVAEGDYA